MLGIVESFTIAVPVCQLVTLRCLLSLRLNPLVVDVESPVDAVMVGQVSKRQQHEARKFITKAPRYNEHKRFCKDLKGPQIRIEKLRVLLDHPYYDQVLFL